VRYGDDFVLFFAGREQAVVAQQSATAWLLAEQG